MPRRVNNADVGELRERITFQSATTTVVTPGGLSNSWANLATAPTVWAHFAPGIGREFRNLNQIEGETIGTFTFRRRTDITRKMRIVFNSINWNIQDVRQDPERVWTYALASEIK